MADIKYLRELPLNKKSALGIEILVSHGILLLTAAATIIPLLWVFISSFNDNNAIYANSFGLPQIWHFENYYRAWVVGNIGTCFFNSCLVSIVSVVGILYI